MLYINISLTLLLLLCIYQNNRFFFVHSNGATSYIGNYDKIEEINDGSSLPKEVLDQHPEIETWDQIFGDVVKSF